ncbi:amino acid ABC transporter ATP-binding protein [Verminephrobacter eiseniae]|uniref:ABC transporter related n=1 Tax=Verminephrobacter eiseniae (strain EF01-2) TaxID=391735 RepID=A1WL38_VEREI|nr:amino acid ABC transporter ATP-binding protein [Verminephrobacter eiseniae]ABM58345.1 ABC transporter related [Verminephrobacter eiseniae EF01-2]MCW5283927.1 amino acid ABC transporter ATP-binding protein [Verminephrobacter eiseniae]MCW5301636.1 amino acid ABC transporter ATP-binding protein [Verminephrobacter eiseniae]MCW8180051.1 amino acid ABC transporter ATP-binding protein [Verminephrobacter eiseniae]MCW8191639.1 amino acid ABC transporter ATP-binding protein [Verminephrobacter eisenia
MPIVEISCLRKQFGQATVLDGVDLQVAEGEVVAIIGRSGSGKSTLLRCINGLERIDGGSIVADGMQVQPSSLRAVRRSVGMIFQSFNLFAHLSALENVALPQMVIHRTPKAVARANAARLLERVGLSARADAYPAKLSGGQQQRVAIARALALEPRILLCDEITSALDPEMVGEVLDVVAELARGGMTMMLVTHEMGFARQAADRLVFMHAGKVCEQGTPGAMLDHPATQPLQQFVQSIRHKG